MNDAIRFLEEEREFHLGFLPTEQSNPLTRGLDRVFAENCIEGVKMLQRVDRDVLAMAERVIGGREFDSLVEAGVTTVMNGGRIIFSGCGATGRLSILLEGMWRNFFREASLKNGLSSNPAALANAVESIMTGGDYALIRSVEFFEDFEVFGRRQVADANMCAKDILVAITEGGETSSVLGTVDEATRRGARAFLLFNNPSELLRERLERSRRAIENPMVTVLDLHCGPMALAGSTRMQATSSEQLVAGAALELILIRTLKASGYEMPDEYKQRSGHVAAFTQLLEQLESTQAINAIARAIDFETTLYRHGGLVTYFADDFLLDIFTDTTERSPTFMLPPFRRNDDQQSPQSWAFVKNPSLPSTSAWQHCLGRQPRCLNWTPEDYRSMNAESIASRPPRIGNDDIMRFLIGNEDCSCRRQAPDSAAIMIDCVRDASGKNSLMRDFISASKDFPKRLILSVGHEIQSRFDSINIACSPEPSPLRLMEHMALKLSLNIISTGTMARMGRLESNWMSWVDVSNKKLIDRGIRLISEIAQISYQDACHELFKSIKTVKALPDGEVKPSPVQFTIEKLRRKPENSKTEPSIRIGH